MRGFSLLTALGGLERSMFLRACACARVASFRTSFLRLKHEGEEGGRSHLLPKSGPSEFFWHGVLKNTKIPNFDTCILIFASAFLSLSPSLSLSLKEQRTQINQFRKTGPMKANLASYRHRQCAKGSLFETCISKQTIRGDGIDIALHKTVRAGL